MKKRQRMGALISLLLFAVLCVGSAFANTITVTNTNDSGSGSLREAIANASPGDTINFGITGTIVLSSTLTITTSLAISGPGASDLAISGNHAVTVFNVNAGVTVTISDVSIENANGSISGGIFNSGTLTVSNSTLSGNYGGNGGGINNAGGLTVSNSTLSANHAYGNGGGIYNSGSSADITGNSTLSDNFAETNGGGIYNTPGGSLAVINSTVWHNCGHINGGGIYNLSLSTLTVSNSSISGNCSFEGGGIWNHGSLTVSNSTLWGNFATGAGGVGGAGGGVWNDGAMAVSNSTIAGGWSGSGGGIYNQPGTLFVKNTIIASGPYGGDCAGTTLISQGHNISDDNSCAAFLTQTGDLNNTPAGLDPNGLQYNGGPTRTIALLPASPAVDAIPVSPTNYCTAVNGTPVTTDQRGIARPQGPACDIGAFELGAQAGFTPTGTNVSVQPTDSTAGGTPVTLTFTTVTQAGITALNTTTGGPPPPTGFKLGNPSVYYNLSTTAVFSGPVRVCVDFAGTQFGNIPDVRLFQYQNNAWTDVTVSLDAAAMTICGSVTSLSQLAIFESVYTASVLPQINANGSSVFSAKAGALAVKFALAADGVATCQLPPATISLTRTAGGAVGPVDPSLFILPSDDGTDFRIVSCQYVYNLGTRALGKGTYVVQISISNVVVGSAMFGLK